MKRRDAPIIARLVVDVLYAFGYLLLVPMAIGLVQGEFAQAFAFAVGAALLIPSLFFLRRRLSAIGVRERHAAMALALAWTLLSLLSSVPFRVYGMGWIDALFESFSAWTDTGLTMIPRPSGLPLSLAVFRVLMQWISGLGIVMFMLFLRGPSPRAAQRLFEAEGRFEDFSSNLWHVGRTVVFIYVGYTFAGFVLLWISGVPPFQALTHAITSLSTGGFSTNEVGVGLYGTWPSLVAILIMLCGGIGFGSHQALISGNAKKFLRNPEIRALFAVIVGASGLLILEHYIVSSHAWDRMLEIVFYVVSSITTCGASTTLSLSQVPDMFVFTLVFLMAAGAVYGSTTGALKLWRLIIIGQVIGREIRRPFYPTDTVMPIRMGNNVISESTVIQVTAYALLYLAIALIGSLVLMLFGYSALHALFTVFSAQGNVGLNAMPDAMYYGMHPMLKVQLILHMLLGRIEILPLFYLLHGLRE
jgi:trk system potassium uptake protein TrkH